MIPQLIERRLITARQGSASPFQDRPNSPFEGLTVLQIIPELNAGGAERSTIDIAAAIAEAGGKALVASLGGRMVSELQAKGGIWVPFPAKTKNPFAMLCNVARLSNLIKRERIDIVHARSRAPAWVGFGASRLTKIPFVTTYHGSYSGKGALKLLYNSVMARGDAVIANSAFTAQRIAELHPAAEGKVRIVHRGVDSRIFSPDAIASSRVHALRRQWNVAPDERIVLLAARLSSWKGHEILIEAARLLVADGLCDTKFVLAGDDQGRGGLVRDVDAAIGKAGLRGIVVRTGHCKDMPAALLAAAVVAVPSTAPEAFGRVAIEAQAMGTPVVASDFGAHSETILAPPDVDPSQRTGWLVPVNDAQALAEALACVLNLGASARETLAYRARTHIESRFSVERMRSETLAAYAALLATSG